MDQVKTALIAAEMADAAMMEKLDFHPFRISQSQAARIKRAAKEAGFEVDPERPIYEGAAATGTMGMYIWDREANRRIGFEVI